MATVIKNKGSDSETENDSNTSSDYESDDNSNLAVDREKQDEEETLPSEDEKSGSEDEEKDNEENTTSVSAHVLTCKAIHSFDTKKRGYLRFEKGDIMKVIENVDKNWIKVDNSKQETGLVPLNYVTFLKHDHKLEKNISEESSKSGKVLWSSLKRAVRQSSATDVLSALGVMPSGFRASTLKELLNHDCKYTLECALAPKLNQSNLGFCDIALDSNNETLEITVSKIQRKIRLVACRSIPLPGAGVNVLSRHIYVCLYDGSSIVSNIHRVSAKWDSQAPKLWSFASRSGLATPSDEDANILIRSRNAHVNLGVLFEVCISLYRASSAEYKEMSCGWVFVKLFDTVGLQINSGTYNLRLHGGSPSEHGIAVDSSIIQSESINPIKAVVTRLRQPTLVIKISRPESQIRNSALFLPSTFVGAISLVQFYSIYRQILGETLLKDRLDNQSAELIYSPVLSQFPSIAAQHDIVDIMRAVWMEKMKLSKRAEKSKPEFLKRLFTSIFMDNIFIFCNIFIPPYSSTNVQVQQARNEIIKNIQTIIKIKGPSGIFLSSQLSFKPFESSKLSLDILGSHCQHVIDGS